jgi:hypothetical protein
MVILTGRELELLVALRDDWERLYRVELARLLQEEAERRGRFDVKPMRPRGTNRLACGALTKQAP